MRPFLIPVAIAAIGTGTLWYATDGVRAVTTEGARRVQIAAAPPTVSSARLLDNTGEIINLVAPAGGVALVEFIYTTCPTVCVSAGILFSQLRDRLTEEGLVSRVRLFSISFDPERDGPEALAAYADAHGVDGRIWKVGVPRNADLPRILSEFGITVIDDNFGGYEHNAAVHVVDSNRRLIGIHDTDDIPGVVAAVRGLR